MACGGGDPDICDFTFGNPHEFPLPGIVDAIQSRAVPENKDWYAYKTSEPEPQAFLAEKVGAELGLDFQPEDIALTSGAFGAIAVTMHMMLDAGDEAIFSLPPWFSYESMLLAADAVPIKVPLKGDRFDLDPEAVEAAIGPKTRLVIVNTPHNPTGRIYDAEALEALAEVLERGSERIGRRIFLLSDEPYRRIRFDGNGFTQSRRDLSLDADLLQLRQGPVGAGSKAGLSGDIAADAAGGARSTPAQRLRHPNGAGVVFPQRADAVHGS